MICCTFGPKTSTSLYQQIFHKLPAKLQKKNKSNNFCLTWYISGSFFLMVFDWFDFLCEHSWCYSHGHKLLEEQLTSVRNVNLHIQGKTLSFEHNKISVFHVLVVCVIARILTLPLFLSVDENIYLNNVSFVLATSTLKRILLQICNSYQPTSFTNVDPICITLVKQPLFEKVSSTMGNHAISFHFSKPKTSITGPPLSRLPCQYLHRPTPT